MMLSAHTNENLQALASSLDTDYTHVTLVDVDTKYWHEIDVNDITLTAYINKRFNNSKQIFIKKFTINNGFAIVNFFYKEELEQYLELQHL